MENKTKDLIIIILITAVMILLSFLIDIFIDDKITEKEQTAFTQGQIYLTQQIQQTGQIPLFTNETGNLTIKMVPLGELCNNIQYGN